MPIDKIALKNFTVFDRLELEFCSGINVLVGVNGKGKTHIMKLLYSAAKPSIPEFPLLKKLFVAFCQMNIEFLD